MNRAALAYIVYYVAIASTAPYLAPYYQSLGLGLAAVGAFASFSASVSLVAGPTWGAIHDRFPRTPWLIPIGALIGASGAITMLLVGASPLLVVAVALLAIGASGVSPMLDVRALDIVGADRTRYSLLRMWGSFSFAIAAPLIGFVVAARGPSGFLLVYLPAVFLAALIVLWLPPKRSTVRSAGLLRAPGRVLTDRTLVIFLLGALVAWIALLGQTAFMTVYLKQLGAPPEEIGLMMSIGAVFEVPTMLLFPRLAARFGLERLLVAGAAIVVVRQLSGALITSPELLIAFTAFQGVGYALLLIGGVAFVSVHAPKGAAASAQGILSAVSFGLASIIGGAAGGVIGNVVGLRGWFACCAVLGAVAAVLIALAVLPVARREKARAAAQPAAPGVVAAVAPIPELPEV